MLELFAIKSDSNNVRVSFDSAKKIGLFKQHKWDNVRFEAVKNHVKLFTSMILSHSSYLVAHSRFVSVFELFHNKWTQTIEFPKNI